MRSSEPRSAASASPTAGSHCVSARRRSRASGVRRSCDRPARRFWRVCRPASTTRTSELNEAASECSSSLPRPCSAIGLSGARWREISSARCRIGRATKRAESSSAPKTSADSTPSQASRVSNSAGRGSWWLNAIHQRCPSTETPISSVNGPAGPKPSRTTASGPSRRCSSRCTRSSPRFVDDAISAGGAPSAPPGPSPGPGSSGEPGPRASWPGGGPQGGVMPTCTRSSDRRRASAGRSVGAAAASAVAIVAACAAVSCPSSSSTGESQKCSTSACVRKASAPTSATPAVRRPTSVPVAALPIAPRQAASGRGRWGTNM
ncbi:hypothetical protein CKO37_12605 [Rubrivivax gelatinosus]|nr:hypothetical protein [Rubrivivax gelatinosus]